MEGFLAELRGGKRCVSLSECWLLAISISVIGIDALPFVSVGWTQAISPRFVAFDPVDFIPALKICAHLRDLRAILHKRFSRRLRRFTLISCGM